MKSLFTDDNYFMDFGIVISELFRSELEKSINEIFEHELTTFLDYDRYHRFNNKNPRNESDIRKIDTKYSQLSLRAQSNRFREFFSSILPNIK